jgi:hypothetical protein
MAVYGLGLQGWDASFEFASNPTGQFDNRVGWFFWGWWEANTPTQIGQYPILARMIYREDVKEGPIISTRCVSPENLKTGKFNFSDTVQQSGDIKEFNGSCPAQALTAGRCVIKFTNTPQKSTFPDMSRYEKDKVITSNTKQLVWNYSGKGFFTVNTAGTKAVVGFAKNKDFTLGKVKILIQSPYVSLFITAMGKHSTLNTAKTALISAMGSSCNTDFKYFDVDNSVLDQGTSPILMEPVRAKITFIGRQIASVNLLDFDGLKTGQTIPVHNNSFEIDSAQPPHSIYYEIVFK